MDTGHTEHHDPDWCHRCEMALEPFSKSDREYPVSAFICPKCRTVCSCYCDGCRVLIAMVYLM